MQRDRRSVLHSSVVHPLCHILDGFPVNTDAQLFFLFVGHRLRFPQQIVAGHLLKLPVVQGDLITAIRQPVRCRELVADSNVPGTTRNKKAAFLDRLQLLSSDELAYLSAEVVQFHEIEGARHVSMTSSANVLRKASQFEFTTEAAEWALDEQPISFDRWCTMNV